MRCGFCGREFSLEKAAEREACGACRGGCRKIHCPYCGYANPAPSGLLRRWLERGEQK